MSFAPLQQDAEAKRFECPEGLGRVYVFRDEQFGYIHPLSLTLNERRIGDFAAMTFAVFDLRPGTYEFASATPEASSHAVVSVTTGSINYLWLEMKMGWMHPRVLLQAVDEPRGKAGVGRSRLITFASRERVNQGGGGTAWLVSSRHLVTNNHVIGDRTTVTVVGSSGAESIARVLARDAANDLCVLELAVGVDSVRPIPLASAPAKVGERSIVIGFPLSDLLGGKPKLTSGDVSASSGAMDDPRFYQFSAPIQPGNSGGPLLNMSGQAIGIVTAKLDGIMVAMASGAIPEGIGYAVKVAYLRPLLDALPPEQPRAREPKSAETVFSEVSPAIFQVKP